jgi:uncharacterized repeat protein (TIGR03847 family)
VTESFEFTEPDAVVPGTIGEPGHRTFFLQARQGSVTASIKVEKQQVAALCEYFVGILADLPPVEPGAAPPTVSASEPDALAWVVGRLSVAYREADDRIVIFAEELLDIDDDDIEDHDLDDPPTHIAAGYDPATARFSLTRAQVGTFIAVGEELVSAGRPPCRLCGRPIDPEGHACPRLN